jgi:acyl-CoA thioesterase YciA
MKATASSTERAAPTGRHITSKLCKTLDVGLRRTLFGGNMMAWMDEAASIFSHRYTGEEEMVTLKFGEIRFVRPVHEGHIVDFYVDNVTVGRTSIHFDLEGWTDDGLVVKTSVVYVAVDKNGRPKPIEKRPDLKPET